MPWIVTPTPPSSCPLPNTVVPLLHQAITAGGKIDKLHCLRENVSYKSLIVVGCKHDENYCRSEKVQTGGTEPLLKTLKVVRKRPAEENANDFVPQRVGIGVEPSNRTCLRTMQSRESSVEATDASPVPKSQGTDREGTKRNGASVAEAFGVDFSDLNALGKRPHSSPVCGESRACHISVNQTEKDLEVRKKDPHFRPQKVQCCHAG